MVRNLLFNGLLAGALTGLLVAILQILLLQPLIVEAERYESGALHVHDGPDDTAAHEEHPAVDEPGPAGLDVTRALLTVAFLAITWAGFGLVVGALAHLVAMMSDRPRKRFLAIGVAGFAAFVIAPTMGLPPELPGMPAADLQARQLWWGFTAAATLGAAVILLLRQGVGAWLASAFLISLPHLIGAPHLADSHMPAVPPDLAALYAARAIAVGFAGWVALAFVMSVIDERQPAA